MARRRPTLPRALLAAAALALVVGLAALVLRRVHPGKAFAIASLGFALVGGLLLPLAWAESRAARRFDAFEARLREAWPDAEVRDVEGGEGHGAGHGAAAAGRGRAFFRDGVEVARLMRPEAGVGAAVLLDAEGRRVEVREVADLRALLDRDGDARPPP